jgi:nucleoid-associated protein YgaU
MPRKKEQKNTSFLDKKYELNVQKLMKNSDSYKSLIYGIVTVVVLFIVIALGVRTLSQNKAEIDKGAISTQTQKETQNSSYTVVEGDTLWSISEKVYNDGFKWKEIADANKISDATTLEKGTKLTIPGLTQETVVAETVTPSVTARVSPTQAPTPTVVAQNSAQSTAGKITANSYTVAHGDYLWEIAIRAYGDGYRWVDIAKANNLSNPDLIYSGNVLKLPRP